MIISLNLNRHILICFLKNKKNCLSQEYTDLKYIKNKDLNLKKKSNLIQKNKKSHFNFKRKILRKFKKNDKFVL